VTSPEAGVARVVSAVGAKCGGSKQAGEGAAINRLSKVEPRDMPKIVAASKKR